MNPTAVLLLHVLFGVACLLGAVWVFVETLHASEKNECRIRAVSLGVAVVMWISYVAGGFWYVRFYGADKAVILKGPWPFAHSLFMETKEHLVMILLLLATYLPIAASGRLANNGSSRRIVLWVAGLVATVALTAEFLGGLISMGAKVALLAR